jgi:hypothetical protein
MLAQANWIFGAASVRVCAKHAAKALDWLVVQPEVLWMDMQQSMKSRDFQAGMMVQDEVQETPLTGEGVFVLVCMSGNSRGFEKPSVYPHPQIFLCRTPSAGIPQSKVIGLEL